MLFSCGLAKKKEKCVWKKKIFYRSRQDLATTKYQLKRKAHVEMPLSNESLINSQHSLYECTNPAHLLQSPASSCHPQWTVLGSGFRSVPASRVMCPSMLIVRTRQRRNSKQTCAVLLHISSNGLDVGVHHTSTYTHPSMPGSRRVVVHTCTKFTHPSIQPWLQSANSQHQSVCTGYSGLLPTRLSYQVHTKQPHNPSFP